MCRKGGCSTEKGCGRRKRRCGGELKGELVCFSLYWELELVRKFGRKHYVRVCERCDIVKVID